MQKAARPDRVLRVYHLRHDDSAETDMFQVGFARLMTHLSRTACSLRLVG